MKSRKEMVGDFITVKYGKIIFDPNSEEAKRLIGKKVIGGYLNEISNPSDTIRTSTLTDIKPNSPCPFFCSIKTSDSPKFLSASLGEPFIREVIEELTYKPFNSFSELLSTYFNKIQIESSRLNNFDFPTIWVKRKDTDNKKSFFASVCGGNDEEVFLANCFPVSYTELLDNYTFLDGSPCGILRGDMFN